MTVQNLVHNTAQNSPDNLSPDPRDNHQHSSDAVYSATGKTWHWCINLFFSLL